MSAGGIGAGFEAGESGDGECLPARCAAGCGFGVGTELERREVGVGVSVRKTPAARRSMPHSFSSSSGALLNKVHRGSKYLTSNAIRFTLFPGHDMTSSHTSSSPDTRVLSKRL